MDLNRITNIISGFIENEIKDRGVKGAVIGVSGGIDSAVVAYLTTKALGKDKVSGIIMPDRDITSSGDITDAQLVCRSLGIEYKLIYINEVKESFFQIIDDMNNNLLIGNLVARIRMCILYYYAGLQNRIVLGTSNKTELTTGYFTKYGDGASDILPVGDLYKTELIKLGSFLGIPRQITEKKSSARLWNNQFTEDELGMSFEALDNLLKILDANFGQLNIDNLLKIFPTVSNRDLSKILSMIKKNKHKTSFPLICKINK